MDCCNILVWNMSVIKPASIAVTPVALIPSIASNDRPSAEFIALLLGKNNNHSPRCRINTYFNNHLRTLHKHTHHQECAARVRANKTGQQLCEKWQLQYFHYCVFVQSGVYHDGASEAFLARVDLLLPFSVGLCWQHGKLELHTNCTHIWKLTSFLKLHVTL